MMAELKKPSVKSKVEAILFSTGHRISLDEISRLSRSRKEDVLASLKELQREYDEKQSSLMLVEEGDSWKFTVRDHFIPIVRKIVTETELSRTMMETLAVIAFKYPILQSDLIKLRTNKAYDHLVELEKSGYITRQKHGRTNLIKLTEKFFRYFDLTEEKLKEQFKDFDSIAKAIKEKEIEIENIKEEQRRKAEELKQQDEKIKKEIESLDETEEEFEVPLDTYEAKPKDIVSEDFEKEGNLIVEKQMIGDLEIVDEVEKAKPRKEEAKAEEKTETIIQSRETQIEAQQPQQQIQHQIQSKKQKKKSEGIKVTPEMQKKVDEKVAELLQGLDKEEKKENQ
jgi:segregation and condensation protein B